MKNIINKKASKDYIMVTGCQRSGTTLTFLIIENHSQVKGMDESEVGKKEHPSVERLFLNRFLGYKTCRKLPTQSADINTIEKYYSNASIVWLIRNPIDTVQSMKDLSYDNWEGNWIQEASHIELDNLKRMFSNANKIDNERCEAVVGAKIWKYNYMAMEEFRESGINVIKVNFENMLREPEKEAKRILRKLNLRFEKEVINFHLRETNENRKLSGNTDASSSIDKKKLEKNIKLTESEREKIILVCGEMARKEGYKVDSKKSKN